MLQLYASLDLGRTWMLVYAMVNPRYYWGVLGHDSDTSTVHLEAEDTATGMRMSFGIFLNKQLILGWCKNCKKVATILLPATSPSGSAVALVLLLSLLCKQNLICMCIHILMLISIHMVQCRKIDGKTYDPESTLE